jgi:hypothetical protein
MPLLLGFPSADVNSPDATLVRFQVIVKVIDPALRLPLPRPSGERVGVRGSRLIFKAIPMLPTKQHLENLPITYENALASLLFILSKSARAW